MPESETALRICPLCEATCGLTLTIDDGRLTGARGDRHDVFSHGFICPKGGVTTAVAPARNSRRAIPASMSISSTQAISSTRCRAPQC